MASNMAKFQVRIGLSMGMANCHVDPDAARGDLAGPVLRPRSQILHANRAFSRRGNDGNGKTKAKQGG